MAALCRQQTEGCTHVKEEKDSPRDILKSDLEATGVSVQPFTSKYTFGAGLPALAPSE